MKKMGGKKIKIEFQRLGTCENCGKRGTLQYEIELVLGMMNRKVRMTCKQCGCTSHGDIGNIHVTIDGEFHEGV